MKCPKCDGTGELIEEAEVGKAMRELRERAGVSVREMARLLGVSAPYISDLELGRRRWNIKLVTAYAQRHNGPAAKGAQHGRE